MSDADPTARAAAWAGIARDGASLDADGAARAAAAGHDADPRVRAAALGALARGGDPDTTRRAWRQALADPNAAVRRRAAELAPAVGVLDPSPLDVPALAARLDDADVTVVEAAAWALGELGATSAVEQLATLARTHDDLLAREAAVGALGAIGDPSGLPAILAACDDRPTVRRRAVLALASFSGPDVDAALRRALGDRDWQVRQAAEDLLAEDLPAEDPLAEDPPGETPDELDGPAT
jgi:HEAT repeat protein